MFYKIYMHLNNQVTQRNQLTWVIREHALQKYVYCHIKHVVFYFMKHVLLYNDIRHCFVCVLEQTAVS